MTGDVIFEQSDNTNWQSVIQRADPTAHFGHDLLLDVMRGRMDLWPAECMSVTPAPEIPHSCNCPSHLRHCFTGWKVTVTGANASHIYIIKGWDALSQSWIGAWPD